MRTYGPLARHAHMHTAAVVFLRSFNKWRLRIRFFCSIWFLMLWQSESSPHSALSGHEAMPCFWTRRKTDFAQDRPLLIFTTGLRLGPGYVRLCSRFSALSMNRLSCMGIFADFGGVVHVELAIPHARRILAFCGFVPIDYSRLKFAFWRKKTDPRA